MKKNKLIFFLFLTCVDVLGQTGEKHYKHQIGTDLISPLIQNSIELNYVYKINKFKGITVHSGYMFSGKGPEIKNSINGHVSGMYIKTGFRIIEKDEDFPFFIEPSLVLSYYKIRGDASINTFYSRVVFPYEFSGWAKSFCINFGVILNNSDRFTLELSFLFNSYVLNKDELNSYNFSVPGIGKGKDFIPVLFNNGIRSSLLYSFVLKLNFKQEQLN